MSFLWHFPWGYPRLPLATALPFAARTFLPYFHTGNQPLVQHEQYYTLRTMLLHARGGLECGLLPCQQSYSILLVYGQMLPFQMIQLSH